MACSRRTTLALAVGCSLPMARPGPIGDEGAARLHRFGELTSRAIAGVIVAMTVTTWLVVGVLTGFPRWWESVLYATGTSVTLVMVFAIQHTQTRQETAIQRKLDELLRAMPHADDRLIAAEDAPDEELAALAELNLTDRDAHTPRTGGPRRS